MRLTLLGILWAQEAFYSDARSGQVVDERIRPAIESGYAVGSAKPVIVVIDEIDGATGDNVGQEILVIGPFAESSPDSRVHQQTHRTHLRENQQVSREKEGG
jgi:hypothetical protein